MSTGVTFGAVNPAVLNLRPVRLIVRQVSPFVAAMRR